MGYIVAHLLNKCILVYMERATEALKKQCIKFNPDWWVNLHKGT